MRRPAGGTVTYLSIEGMWVVDRKRQRNHHEQQFVMLIESEVGLIEEGYAITTVHRQLSDLTPLFDT